MLNVCITLLTSDLHIFLEHYPSSPEDESSLLLKRRVCVLSEDEKSPNTHEWYFACYTVI
jgi:hypothetical protein